MRGVFAIKQFFFILFFFSIAHVKAGTISGIVSDSKSGSPLMGANIVLAGTMLGSATDEDGNFQIKNVPIGDYTLRAMFIGYEILEKNIDIESEQEYIVDIKLKPSAIELQETRVTAERRKEKITEAPASIEIITSRDIKRESTTNIGSYLKGLKGVDFTSSGINNYSISIRGFNSSFNTRLLTLTDGRVANIPALRVINYSTVPQSMDDIDKMEVVLGPATALYGANAHGGVVNIISKPPAQSEGLTMSVSGSNDDRSVRKINGRFAKKISETLSIKLSGMYLHAYEWPYISELEYKSHLYPWSGTPGRMNDGKDNNPWNASNDSLLIWAWAFYNNDSILVRIGDGEANHGDLDGDGVAGEDWWNGYDDDGDCPGDTNQDGCYCCSGDSGVDEDYFFADGIDNDGDCPGDTNGDGCICCSGDSGVDENIDIAHDKWYDGYDNDNNGNIDDPEEMFTNRTPHFSANWGANIDISNILVFQGRQNEFINGEANPWYIEGVEIGNAHVFGDYYFDENNVQFVFDVFIYDYGKDGVPGDAFEDLGGDGIYQQGELAYYVGAFWNYNDCGLDGLCPNDAGYPGFPDVGEGDGVWQPGDGWQDLNGNGIVDEGGDDGYIQDPSIVAIWPLPNGTWDENEPIFDCGQDGLCPGDFYYPGPDFGEGDGILPLDPGDYDGIFDTGDGIYGYNGETFVDSNENGIWDEGEIFQDINSDGSYTPPDYNDNYQLVSDINGDGKSDYPDFEVDNRKFELRVDYDPSEDINMTFQSGYSWTKTQQVTGTGRYLADGFEYRYFQLRGRYKNWYSQYYENESNSGDTRGYNLGNWINDKSKNIAYQLQHNFILPRLNTKLVWGLDYFKTMPQTFGTILNDGPNGYDNDGDNIFIKNDGIDNDGDGLIDETTCYDGGSPGFRDGKIWECGEGIDEPDEWVDAESNEIGLYFQSKTELFGTSRYKLITAARFDHHDLLSEGIQFAPKLGFIFKPDDRSSMRFTYGKAFNTPNSITLFTDIFIRKFAIMDIYLRGNKDGTPYPRVGDDYSVQTPGYYTESGDFHSISPVGSEYFVGNDDLIPYEERVAGAPFFFNMSDAGFPTDMIALDTSRYLIYIPELNDDGVLYNASQSFGIPDVEPIKTEKIQTVEFGYKGFLWNRTQVSFDYYLSFYEDFFSPPTVITPLVVRRVFDSYGNDVTDLDDLNVVGIMPINSFGSNPPYGTAWNGIDDDGDWVTWADEFGWWDDKNQDGNPMDPGEWGLVDETGDTPIIYHPYEIVIPLYGGLSFGTYQNEATFWTAVGVDEYHPTTGLSEYETMQTGLVDGDGNPIEGPGRAYSPPHMVLSPMNYGNVWMQGIDMGFTQLIPELKLIIDGNFSWYGTTEYYNELTKKNDPINAPKFKWNASFKWDSPIGNLAINFRHVDKFVWKDGIWAGVIGPYNITDIHFNYELNKYAELSVSALNIFDDVHKELIGGAAMGRQIILRMTSTF